MTEILTYAMESLLWSVLGFAVGIIATILYLTSTRGRQSNLGQWLLQSENEKVAQMDIRLKRRTTSDPANDFPYRPWRRYLGPILILLAVLSAISMTYDANKRNDQTRCLAGFVESVTTNIVDVRALTAQDRQLLDDTIKKLVVGQPPQVAQQYLERLRNGESAESVLTDVFKTSAKNDGTEALRRYLAERARIEAERAQHPLPQITNCIRPGDLPHPAPSIVPSGLPSGSSSG